LAITISDKTNKKQQLLNSALTLFVNRGIDATSTASIAKHAGVATGTLFHHFATKEALVLALYKKTKQEFSLQIAPFQLDKNKLKQQAKLVWDQAIDWGIVNADKQQFCRQVSQYPKLSSEVRAEVLAEEFGSLALLIQFGQQHKIIADYPLAMMVDHAHSQYMSSTLYLINHPKLVNDQVHREAIFEMFWKAFSL
jgi:AcrR family transcriptional regulator